MNYTFNLNDKMDIEIYREYPASEPGYSNYFITTMTTGETLYVGRVFFDVGDVSKTVCISDIVERLKDKDHFKYEKLTVQPSLPYHYVMNLKIELTEYADRKNPAYVSVKLYHNQRGLKGLGKHEECIEREKMDYLPMLSGIEVDDSQLNLRAYLKLLPVIPYNYNGGRFNNYISLNAGTSFAQLGIGKMEGQRFTQITTVQVSTPSSVDDYAPQIMFDETLFNRGDIVAIMIKGDFAQIAKIDDCDSKYYLKWFDRCGGIQMQPFRKYSKYKSDYDYINKINKYGEEEMISASVSDTITINTGWVSEDVLPYYESIFVSPALCLWDNEAQEHMQVVIVDKSFEYKTFHNQGRQMFNLQLTLKLAQKENILY